MAAFRSKSFLRITATTLWVLFCCCCNSSLWAQSRPSPADPELLLKIAYSSPSSALSQGRQWLADGTLTDEEREAILFVMGRAAYWSNAASVSEITRKLYRLADSSERPTSRALADALNTWVELDEGKIKQGMAHLEKAVSIMRAQPEPYWQALADTELCDAFYASSREADSIEPCQRALLEWRQQQKPFEVARVQNLLMLSYTALGKYGDALAHGQSALAFFDAEKVPGGVAMISDGIGEIYLALKKPEQALRASSKALAFERKAGKTHHAVQSQGNVAKALSMMGRYAEAQSTLSEAIASCEELGDQRLLEGLLERQFELALLTGKMDLVNSSAKQLLKLVRARRDEITQTDAKELSIRYSAEAKAREVEHLKQERDHQVQIWTTMLMAAAAVLLFAGLYAFGLRRTNLALSKVDQARAHALARAAHEIRNPVAAIRGLLELIQRNNGKSDVNHLLESAKDAADSLVQISEDYLDHAQLTLGKLEPRYELVELRPWLERITQLYQAEVQRKGLTLSMTVDPALPRHLQLDRERMRQILSNLIGNAVKFTDRGRIELTAEARSSSLVIAVNDTGPGITADDLTRIFDSFDRGRGEQRKKQGSGLGLSIARQIAERLGGQLVASSTPGIGSRFELRLPLTPLAAAESTPEPIAVNATTQEAPALALDPNNLRVLLAEDEPVLRELMQAQLEAEGVLCDVAETVEQAFQLCLLHRPMAVLVDLHLHEESGLHLIRRIRASSLNPLPLLIVVSGDREPLRSELDSDARWDHWLTKPVDLMRLLTWLKRPA